MFVDSWFLPSSSGLLGDHHLSQPDPVALANHDGFSARDKAIIYVDIEWFAVGFAELEHGTGAKSQDFADSYMFSPEFDG